MFPNLPCKKSLTERFLKVLRRREPIVFAIICLTSQILSHGVLLVYDNSEYMIDGFGYCKVLMCVCQYVCKSTNGTLSHKHYNFRIGECILRLNFGAQSSISEV